MCTCMQAKCISTSTPDAGPEACLFFLGLCLPSCLPNGLRGPSTYNSAISCGFLSKCPLDNSPSDLRFERIYLTFTDYIHVLCLVLCGLFPIFFGPLAFNLEYFIPFCALGHPQALRAGISCNSKEQIQFFLSWDIWRNSWDFCLGRYARSGKCFQCHYTKKPATMKQGFSCVLFVCCQGDAGNEIQV